MIYLVLAGVGAFAFVLLVRVLWAKTQPKVSTAIVVGAAAVLIGVLAVLTATGRFHPIAAFATAVLPFLRRGFFLMRLAPMLSSMSRMFQSAGNQSFDSSQQPKVTESETSELKMVLDHATGEISGKVKTGPFRGRELSSLTSAEVAELYRSLEDERSRRLMVSFIERHHPNLDDAETTSASDTDAPMTVKRACEVLGVEETASDEDVVKAHRRMIQHLHPDRGGSSYLAATLNEAKRVLLERR